jgi:hypothetical protein
MSVPLLSALREPPVVGLDYLVPTVRYRWAEQIEADWPVLGPRHEDREYFDFSFPHYHLDVRFIGPRRAWKILQHVILRERIRELETEEEIVATAASTWPLYDKAGDAPLPRPVLRRRRCVRADIPTRMPDLAPVKLTEMAERYGRPAEPIRTRDGRLLCPHRKVDLSQLAPDAEGNVVCPLHGLTVTGLHSDSEGIVEGIHGSPDPKIDWVIVGGESGPRARPMHPDWARSLRDQCAAAGVPFFFKQWGAWAPVHLRACSTGEAIGTLAHQRVGKKAAGRLLDGVEHSGMPAHA